MATALTHQLRQILVALFCVATLVYFFVYAVSGRHGLEHRRALMGRLAVADVQTTKLEALRAALLNDVERLGGERPDADLVSEYALKELGLVPPQARIVRLESAP
jgi:cell division protein FtsB